MVLQIDFRKPPLATHTRGLGVSYAPFKRIAGCFMSLSGRISTQAARILQRVLLLAGTLAALGAGPAVAVTVTGLYSVEVPVEGAQSEDLSAGYAEGLKKVFVRVSGSRDVLANEGLTDLLSNAESLLQSYQVLRSEGGDRLRMTFGAVGVNNALASVDAPVWGANMGS